MIRAGLLLAAGASRRFGAEDKLLAPLQNRPLITYAAQIMRETKLDRRIAVISNPALTPYLDGFDVVEIAPTEQSASIRAGVLAAGNCDRLLMTLADMPGITCDLLQRLLDTVTDERPSASRDSGPLMPPVCFPSPWFSSLLNLTGDKGAGGLIRELPPEAQIYAPGLLQDIDTVYELQDMQAHMNGH